MSTENVEVFNKYYGNGVATQFSIGFPYLKREYVKVYLYRGDTSKEVRLNTNQFSFVNDTTIQFPVLDTDDVLQEGDILTIQRETTLGSEFEFDNQRRLFPVEVMNADDLAFQQIQELYREVNRSVRVNPTADESPEELLNTVYNKLDSATAIAGDAINAANQAQTAADNATAAVNQAEQTLTEVTNYVDLAKSDINNTKNTAISTIDSTVAQAKSDINTAVSNAESNISAIVSDAEGSITNIAVTEANKAIANAAQEATDIATANLNSYVDGTVKPSLQTYVDQAQADANSAATSMEQAALSATAASNYASNASADADNAAESAGLAANSAAAAAESEGKAAEYLQQVSDKITVIEGSIGDIGFAPLGIDETQNKRRYLNGQVISQTQFATFTNKVKSAVALYPSLSATEENWQAEVTNSKLGQCGKFVIDDTAGTIRLPKVVNINGLQDLSLSGGIKNESLPNIKGETGGARGGTDVAKQTGVFSGEHTSNAIAVNSLNNTSLGALSFDASFSSSTYQNGAPVQQEAVQYPYFIQVAAGSAEMIDVSTEIQLNNPFFFGMHIWSDTAINNASWLISNGSYHSGATYVDFYQWLLKIKNGTLTVDGVSVKAYGASDITDYDYVINTADTTFRLPLRTKDDYVVEEYSDSTNWYRVYKSGWIEQGGYRTFTSGTIQTINLMKAFNNTNYTITTGYGYDQSTTYDVSVRNSDKITSSFKLIAYDTLPSAYWQACGQGAETPTSKTYFYVGETVQDANVINAAGVLTRVANCIDRTVASDRETVVGWGMPNYSAGVSVASGFTAAYNGFLKVYISSGYPTINITVNDVQVVYFRFEHHYTDQVTYLIPIAKGDVVTLSGSGPSATFFPMKGA